MKRFFNLLVVFLLMSAFLAMPVAAKSPTKSFILLSNTEQLPVNIDAQVAASGGLITKIIPEIGIAIVESSDAKFAKKAVKIAGIQDVLPNLEMEWVKPVNQVDLGEDFGNPPFSGDDDLYFDLQWGHDAVNAPEAWAAGHTGAGVRVAVLDGGFDLDHPDLEPNINFDLSKDFSGEGLQYTLPDTFSHGSHTAGTIGAADNGVGTIGIAPDVDLVLVKVLGDAGSGSFGDVIDGIVYAANIDADVINMSLGAHLFKSGGCDDEGCYKAYEVVGLLRAMDRATNYAYQMGSTIIAAAGNNAVDMDHSADLVHIPSDSVHVISISATAPIGWATDPQNIFLDNLASYSNYGQSAIEFGAPGGDVAYPGNEVCTVGVITHYCFVFDLVFSTGNDGWYWGGGTSMAAPHASGVAAIIIGMNGGEMHPSLVEAAMQAVSEDLGKPGNDDAYGTGRVHTGFYDLP